MSSAAADSSRANARSRVESRQYPKNLVAGREISPLTFERFDLAAAPCELDCAHRVFQRHPSRSTLQRLLNAICRHRELTRGTL
jgi:hypothetical protein